MRCSLRAAGGCGQQPRLGNLADNSEQTRTTAAALLLASVGGGAPSLLKASSCA